MKAITKRRGLQPETFSPGVSKGMVRQHAFMMFRDKLHYQSLSLEDWVLAEKDLAQSIQLNGALKR